MRISIEELEKKIANKDRKTVSGEHIQDFPVKFFFRQGEHTKHVKLLIDKPSDVIPFTTHSIEGTSKKGKTYYTDISCNGDGCDFCKVANRTKGKTVGFVKDTIVIPLLDLDNQPDIDEKPVISYWVRPVSFYTTLTSFISHYKDGFRGVIEVEKTGEKKTTRYLFYPDNSELLNKIVFLSNEEYLSKVSIDRDLKYIIPSYTPEKMQEYISSREGSTVTTDHVEF